MKTYTVGVDEKHCVFVQEWSSGVTCGQYVPGLPQKRKYFDNWDEACDYAKTKSLEAFGGGDNGKREELL